MQAQLEILPQLKRRLKLCILRTDIQQIVANKLKNITKTAKVPGFRPGKAPLKIITKMYEKNAYEEALEATVQDTFLKAVRAHNLRIAGSPHFEKDDSGDQMNTVFNAVFEVMPDIPAIDLSQIQIEKPLLTITDEEVQKVIDNLRKKPLGYNPVERGVIEGDQVIIDFEGTIDNTAFSGGCGQNARFIIGQGKMLPDFEAAILGMVCGENKTFDLTFPQNYDKTVAGKQAQFNVTIKSIEAPILPDDETLAIKFDIPNGDIKKMHEEIHRYLSREVRLRLRDRSMQNIITALIQSVPFELPTVLVNAEFKRILQSTLERLRSQGYDPEKIPDLARLRESLKQQAESQVHFSLIANELLRAHQHELDATPEQIRAIVHDGAQTYNNPDEIEKWYYADPSRLAEPRNKAIENNIIDYILSKAQVTEKSIQFESLMEIH